MKFNNYTTIHGRVVKAYELPVEEINDLNKSLKDIVEIPQSLESAIDISKANNPDIQIAKYELDQTEKDIQIAKSDLAPSATLSLERSYSDDLSSTYDERNKNIFKTSFR